MNKTRLIGKKVLITGAANGLGRELALRLSEIGCTLYLVDRDLVGLKRLVKTLRHSPHFFQSDMSIFSERKELIRNLNSETRIDILINCAGIGSHSEFTQLSVDEIERVMQVNAIAPLELMVGLSPLDMIVNIGSVAGEMHLASVGLYSASKASVHAFTHSIQMEGVQALLVILGPLRGTEFVRSIEHPRTGQPKLYRDLDLPVDVAAKHIIKAIENRKKNLVMPFWYQFVLSVERVFAPLMRSFGHLFLRKN